MQIEIKRALVKEIYNGEYEGHPFQNVTFLDGDTGGELKVKTVPTLDLSEIPLLVPYHLIFDCKGSINQGKLSLMLVGQLHMSENEKEVIK